MYYFNRVPSNASVSNDSAALRGLLVLKYQRNCGENEGQFTIAEG